MVWQALFIGLFPALVIWAARRSAALRWMGPVVLCYLGGIAVGNLLQVDQGLSMSLAEVAVPLAIPLLLFSTDFGRWLRHARQTALSFALMLGSVLVATFFGARLFADRVAEFWQIGGMLVGVYTGGTINMSAIGLALGVREETFVVVNAADVVLGGLYLIFLMTVAQRLLLRFLPPFRHSAAALQDAVVAPEPAPLPVGLAAQVLGLLPGLGLAALLVGASVGLSLLLQGGISEVVVFLALTTLGIAASFLRRVRALPGTYAAAEYLLLIFCVAVGSLANFAELLQVSPYVFYYVATVMFGAIILHLALATLLRIDADTAIITSAAGIYGPAFIGPIAGVLKNREVVISGLTSGLIGFALGNYLGVAMAYLLKP